MFEIKLKGLKNFPLFTVLMIYKAHAWKAITHKKIFVRTIFLHRANVFFFHVNLHFRTNSFLSKLQFMSHLLCQSTKKMLVANMSVLNFDVKQNMLGFRAGRPRISGVNSKSVRLGICHNYIHYNK